MAESTKKPEKVSHWRYIFFLFVIVVAASLLVPQLSTLRSSIEIIRNMSWWFVGLAIICEICSYLGSGYVLHTILKKHNQFLSVFKGALIAMSSYSIGLVAGGFVGGSVATYRWIRRESNDRRSAVLAGTLPALLNNVVLVGISMIGVIYLSIINDLSNLEFAGFCIALFLLVLTIVCIALAVVYQEQVIKLITWLAQRWSILRKKPFSPINTITIMKELIITVKALKGGKWLRPLSGAVMNVGFDMLALYFLFVATGYQINPWALCAGYGLPLMIARIAFLIPGGVGVIEGSMVAIFTSVKVPPSLTLLVILAYRLISFWIPTLGGFVGAIYLSRKSLSAQKKVTPEIIVQ